MTPTREELMAQIAEREAANERDRAKLAALDAEPDWEAWRPALKAFEESRGNIPPSTPFNGYDFKVIRALQAALPLAPAPTPMGEREIAELARELRVQYENTRYSTEEAIALVIRETLRRVPAAPPMGEESAEEFADYLAQFFDQRVGAWRSKVVRAIIERDRRTLSRVPSWPGEGELREMARAIAREGFLGASYHVKDAALEMARRLKERMGAGGGA